MIVIDIQNLGFAATAANANLTSNGVFTGGVFGVVRALRRIREEYAGRMVCLWDGRSWRHELFPAYKANRKADPKLVAIKDQWKTQKLLVVRALKAMGIDQLAAENLEADDLAARIVTSRGNMPVTLVTGDKDWLQLIRQGVVWIDPIRERRVTPDSFAEFTSYDTTWKFTQAKALTGDASDNIPGVGGVGPVAVKWIFDNYGSVDALCNESVDRASMKWPKKIIDFVDDHAKVSAYKRNLKLVWLNHPEAPPARNPRKSQGALDVAAFEALGEELNFHSILKDARAWLAPFISEQQHAKELAA